MKIELDNKIYEIKEGQTILEIARENNISIPSLCYHPRAEHRSSCMVCAVINAVNGQVIPSCTTVAMDGMKIDTTSETIRTVRRTSLELLLSDHRADCQAPCQRACPGGMDIAMMNRLIEKGLMTEALGLLRDTLVMPASLCYICPAPCEKVCRKSTAVEIREWKKRLVKEVHSTPPSPISNGKRALVYGSTMAAYTASYSLRKVGYHVTLIAERPLEGVPTEIFEYERAQLGFDFTEDGHYDLRILIDGSPIDDKYDYTMQTRIKQPARLALLGHDFIQEIMGKKRDCKPYNSSFDTLTTQERLHTTESPVTGCLLCDCTSKNDCLLREYASEYEVDSKVFARSSAHYSAHSKVQTNDIVFEVSKCIKCGLCVYNSEGGFAFTHRGFEMEVTMTDTSKVQASLARLCPTGAIVLS